MIRALWSKLMKWGWDYNRNLRVNEIDSPDIAVCEDRSANIEGLIFTVMPAQGGTIVQMRQYDKKSHEHSYSTHVIPQGEDVTETIGKIVAMEMWKA